jgi:hypothetical protein
MVANTVASFTLKDAKVDGKALVYFQIEPSCLALSRVQNFLTTSPILGPRPHQKGQVKSDHQALDGTTVSGLDRTPSAKSIGGATVKGLNRIPSKSRSTGDSPAKFDGYPDDRAGIFERFYRIFFGTPFK